jgi:hypothetical protein
MLVALIMDQRWQVTGSRRCYRCTMRVPCPFQMALLTFFLKSLLHLHTRSLLLHESLLRFLHIREICSRLLRVAFHVRRSFMALDGRDLTSGSAASTGFDPNDSLLKRPGRITTGLLLRSHQRASRLSRFPRPICECW